ncbi:hypothetical protein Tco_0250701 [Tanacetum coccineum]
MKPLLSTDILLPSIRFPYTVKVINLPRATIGDTSPTHSYIPKVSQTPGIAPSIAHFYKPIEDRCIHEGRVADQLYYTSNHIDRSEQQYNLAYFFVKRIESARATPKAHLPYGMFLTRLFRHVMGTLHDYRLIPLGTVFREPPYPFDYPIRRLTMEEILAKFIFEGRRKHKEMEIFIKEFRTTNEILLKTRSNLLSELKIEVNELSKVVSNVLIPKNEVKGVTTRGGKMTSEATRSKEINKTGINKNALPDLNKMCRKSRMMTVWKINL